jgi:hypothetical protein
VPWFSENAMRPVELIEDTHTVTLTCEWHMIRYLTFVGRN